MFIRPEHEFEEYRTRGWRRSDITHTHGVHRSSDGMRTSSSVNVKYYIIYLINEKYTTDVCIVMIYRLVTRRIISRGGGGGTRASEISKKK